MAVIFTQVHAVFPPHMMKPTPATRLSKQRSSHGHRKQPLNSMWVTSALYPNSRPCLESALARAHIHNTQKVPTRLALRYKTSFELGQSQVRYCNLSFSTLEYKSGISFYSYPSQEQLNANFVLTFDGTNYCWWFQKILAHVI